jgi:hypothetical protein
MALIENIYQVRNADDASVMQPHSVGYAHTDQQLREALESARVRSLNGVAQVVVDLAQVPESVIARFQNGVRI